MKRADVDLFEKLVAQLEGFHEELSVLVKKAPGDAVNAFKLKFINDVVRQLNGLLGQKYLPFPDFETFSLDDVPSTSDVSFILSQYIECAEKFRADRVEEGSFGEWYWAVDNGTGVRSRAPKHLTGKRR